MDYRARWEGGRLRLISNSLPDLAEGEDVIVTIERGRSMASHRHQFAWLNDVWMTLPEHLRDMPWAASADTMRKHALIAKGYHQTYTLDCGANATAQRIKAALVSAEAKANGYAIGQVRGPVLTIWTPESQSVRAMGGDRFKESKEALMGWIAEKLGCDVDEVRRAAA